MVRLIICFVSMHVYMHLAFKELSHNVYKKVTLICLKKLSHLIDYQLKAIIAFTLLGKVLYN